LGVSAKISQISNTAGLEGVVNPFLCFGGIRKIGCEFFQYLENLVSTGTINEIH
jgi:hypothetical protein